MIFSIRAIACACLAALFALSVPAQTSTPATRFEVALLGTGTPGPNPLRFGPSTLVSGPHVPDITNSK